jgi:hypothetical protein
MPGPSSPARRKTARDAYQLATDKALKAVFWSAELGLLGLPWELMRNGAGPGMAGLRMQLR